MGNGVAGEFRVIVADVLRDKKIIIGGTRVQVIVSELSTPQPGAVRDVIEVAELQLRRETGLGVEVEINRGTSCGARRDEILLAAMGHISRRIRALRAWAFEKDAVEPGFWHFHRSDMLDGVIDVAD